MENKDKDIINYNIDFKFHYPLELDCCEYRNVAEYANDLLEDIDQDFAFGSVWDYLEMATLIPENTKIPEDKEELEGYAAAVASAFPGLDYLGMVIRTNHTEVIIDEKPKDEMFNLAVPLEFDITLKFRGERKQAETAIRDFLDIALESYTQRGEFFYEEEGLLYFYGNSEMKGYTDDGEVLEHFRGDISFTLEEPKDKKSYYCHDVYFCYLLEGEDTNGVDYFVDFGCYDEIIREYGD